MLFRVLKRMIERGEREGLQEKLDIFHAVDSLSKEEYFILTEMLRN